MARRRSNVLNRRRLFFLATVMVALVAGGAFLLLEPLDKTIRELTLPLRHEDIVRQQANDKQLDPALLAAVIYAESKFRPRRSAAGAEGLMQILPSTARYIARKSGGTKFELRDLDDPQVNISYGSWYLRYLKERFGGDETLALAAYNAGERHVERWRLKALKEGEDVNEIDNIPFPETRSYVRRVLRVRESYRSKYADELGYK